MKFKWFYLFLAFFAYDFMNERIQDLLMLELDLTKSFQNNESILLLISQLFTFYAYSFITYLGFFHFYPKRKWGYCILFIILGFTLPISLRYLIEELLYDLLFGFTNYYQRVSFSFYMRDNSIYAFRYAPFGIVFFFIQYTLFKEAQAKKLVQVNHEMELSLLRSQINPHFLLNSLNNVYALVYQKSDKALKAIDTLSGLLKYSLYENSELVSVSTELESVYKIIELQKMRLSYEPAIQLNIDDASLDHQIPPFILMSIIENAFKHGDLKDANTPLIIQIEKSNNQIMLSTENQKGNQSKDLVGGIGLQNIRKRLALSFPNENHFEIQESNTTFKIQITLPLL
ncbi:MAG: histidine kinase [Flavobacteriales bacterium]|nr:histidine kinase [Flavobacteriales bacterium]